MGAVKKMDRQRGRGGEKDRQIERNWAERKIDRQRGRGGEKDRQTGRKGRRER